jgi:hypothetical protein
MSNRPRRIGRQSSLMVYREPDALSQRCDLNTLQDAGRFSERKLQWTGTALKETGSS